MNIHRLIMLCLMAQAATQTCFAGTVEQFGTTQIYGKVDSQGIPIFTDIPMAEDVPPPNIDAPLTQGKRRPRSPDQEALPHHDGADISLPRFAELPPARFADSTPPSLRDGGAPPEDH